MEWTAKEISMLIAAALTVLGTIVVALINRQKKTTSEQKQPGYQPLVVVQATMPVSTTSQMPRSSPPTQPTADLRPLVTNITHREIVDKLRGLTPYHRDVVEKSYVGVRVRWRVLLHSLGALTSGNAHLHGDISETKSAINCEGAMEDFKSLMHAADREEVEIEGTIDFVSDAYSVLKDCTARRIANPREVQVKT